MKRTSSESSTVLTTIRRGVRRTGRAVFGDRLGIVVFLVGLVFATSYWRIGIFVTDSYAIGNTLANLADGHVAIRKLQYSITFGSQPGLYFHDGAVYGRNYGHALISLPVLWVLDAFSAVFDLRLVIAAGFSLLLFGLAEQCGLLLDRYRSGIVVGGVLASVAFVLNAVVASPLDAVWKPLIALQTTTMVAMALVGVVLYRLFSTIYGQRVGLGLGLVTNLASPVAFWASIPKRHVLTALAVVVVVTAFYFSRSVESPRRSLASRALSYAAVALLASVHAPEALMLLAALGPVDLLTARTNHPRQLVAVGLVFLLALTPFLATNYAISGNPVQPPRMLDDFDGQVDVLANQSDGSTSGSDDSAPASDGSRMAVNGQSDSAPEVSSTGSSTTSPSTMAETGRDTPTNTSSPGSPVRSSWLDLLLSLILVVPPLVDRVLAAGTAALARFWGLFEGGFAVALEEPERLYHTFVRSGRIPFDRVRYDFNQQEAIELTILETAPLTAAAVGSVSGAIRRAASSYGADTSLPTRLRRSVRRPERQTDILVVTIFVLFTLAYLERLPYHTQITVRYLVPLVPLLLYAVGRLPCVSRLASADWRWFAGAYLGTVTVGFFGAVLANTGLSLALGEAMQLQAIVGLVSALPLTVWAVLEEAGVETDSRAGAVVIALPTGLTTVFLLLTGFVYFQYAEYALPLARVVTELLPVGF